MVLDLKHNEAKKTNKQNKTNKKNKKKNITRDARKRTMSIPLFDGLAC